MADEADRSDDKIEAEIEIGVANIRRCMASRELTPIGACHWCNEYVKGEKLFCCKECSDDWERNKRYYK